MFIIPIGHIDSLPYYLSNFIHSFTASKFKEVSDDCTHIMHALSFCLK